MNVLGVSTSPTREVNQVILYFTTSPDQTMQIFDPKRRYTGLFIPNCLAESRDFSCIQKVVWGRLVQYSDDTGVAWPKIETLARDCAISVRSVCRVIEELEGVLLEVERPDGVYRLSHRSNRYRFLYHEVFREADSTACQFVMSGSANLAPPQNKTHMKGESPTGGAPAAPASYDGKTYLYRPEHENTAQAMYVALCAGFPEDSPPNMPYFPRWANTIRLLRELDGRSDSQIMGLWSWVIHHDYWRARILSPGGLRKRWDQLIVERQHGIKTDMQIPPAEGKGDGKYAGIDTIDG